MTVLGGLYKKYLNNAYKAVYWYTKGDKGGDSNATYFLGTCYHSGYGVEKDSMMGTCYFITAAQHGNEFAIEAFREKGMSVEEMRANGFPV